MSRRGILFSLVRPQAYYALALAVFLPVAVLIAYGLGRLARRIRSRGWAIAAGLALGVLVGIPANGLTLWTLYRLFPTLQTNHYATVFLGLFALVLTAPLTLVTAAVSAGYRRPSLSG